MFIIEGKHANALLLSFLLLVADIIVIYMTQDSPYDNRNPNIKKKRSSWLCLVHTCFIEWILGRIAQSYSG